MRVCSFWVKCSSWATWQAVSGLSPVIITTCTMGVKGRFVPHDYMQHAVKLLCGNGHLLQNYRLKKSILENVHRKAACWPVVIKNTALLKGAFPLSPHPQAILQIQF